jgi:hypothetical protein
MSDLFDKIKDERNIFEKIASFIPGFGGYMNKDSRREADKMLRDAIVNRLGEQLTRLQAIQTDLISNGGIEYVDDVGTAVTRLQTFSDMVKTAAYGYAGFFDAVKVDEDALQKLYNYDNQLLDKTNEVKASVDSLQAASGDTVKVACRALNTIASDCITAFERRKEVLLS